MAESGVGTGLERLEEWAWQVLSLGGGPQIEGVLGRMCLEAGGFPLVQALTGCEPASWQGGEGTASPHLLSLRRSAGSYERTLVY